jgi:CelD/BcsL family acetyltransferase involved in cellulose biosynthesis
VIRIAKITDEASLLGLRAEWEALWQRDSAATPFQWPAWLLAWWRYFGTPDLFVLTARDGGELVAILPLYLFHESGCRKLLPIGVGLSDYIDALGGQAGYVAADLFMAAIAETSGWDECWLPDLAPEGLLAQAAAVPGVTDRFAPAEPCPILALPGELAGLGEVIPRTRLHQLHRARRRAAAMGGVLFETITEEEVDAAMDDLFRLHDWRWQARGAGGLCGDPAVQGFHRAGAAVFSAAGMLRLHRMSIDGAALAVCYGFAAKGSAYAYLSGFDPAHSQLSPGMLIISYAVEQACIEGAARFDFLRGSEGYKYSWGAVDRSKTSRHLSRR